MNKQLQYFNFIHSLNVHEVEKEFLQQFVNHQDFQQIEDTVALIKEVHHGQLRKNNKEPYYIHLLRIVLTMYKCFNIVDTKLFISALLHDTLEDTRLTKTQISKLYGAEILANIQALTLPPSKYGTAEFKYNIRKEDYAKLKKSSLAVRYIKFFDNLDNFADLATIDKHSRFYLRIPRYMAQTRDFALPLARTLKPEFYQFMRSIYDKYISLGLQPMEIIN